MNQAGMNIIYATLTLPNGDPLHYNGHPDLLGAWLKGIVDEWHIKAGMRVPLVLRLEVS